MFKKKDEKKPLKANIKIVYNIGSKTHKKEFKAYALFGQWYAENWVRITKVVDIQIDATY